LPPGVITTRIAFVSQCRYQDGFNSVQPVLSLVEDNGCMRFENLVCDLQCFQAIYPVDFFPQLRISIVQGGQAVHKFRVGIICHRHEMPRHLVGKHQLDALALLLELDRDELEARAQLLKRLHNQTGAAETRAEIVDRGQVERMLPERPIRIAPRRRRAENALRLLGGLPGRRSGPP